MPFVFEEGLKEKLDSIDDKYLEDNWRICQKIAVTYMNYHLKKYGDKEEYYFNDYILTARKKDAVR